MSETIWGFSPAARNYGAWNGSVSTNSVSNIIPEGQAFFVRAIGSSPVITMDNAVRLHDFSAFLKSSNLVPDVLHLLVVGTKGQDEIAIQFADDATFFLTTFLMRKNTMVLCPYRNSQLIPSD